MADGSHIPRRPADAEKAINLALQGAGAHGAFTWGVLDRLLEDGRIGIEGVSATGGGAVNAVVFAHGFSLGGPEGARTALANFWRRMSHASPLAVFPLVESLRGVPSTSPAAIAMEMMSRLFSPYELNPLNIDPVRRALAAEVDFEQLQRASAVQLHLGATNVRTGRLKVFANAEISLDVVMASSCQPMLSQAVEIDGEAYWDGGYAGNPTIFPFLAQARSRDVVLVRVIPQARRELPRSAQEIARRIGEISFNASLSEELRAVATVARRIDSGDSSADALRRLRLHVIEADEILGGFAPGSRLHTDWAFLTGLRDLGRAQANRWLAGGFDCLGVRGALHEPLAASLAGA